MGPCKYGQSMCRPRPPFWWEDNPRPGRRRSRTTSRMPTHKICLSYEVLSLVLTELCRPHAVNALGFLLTHDEMSDATQQEFSQDFTRLDHAHLNCVDDLLPAHNQANDDDSVTWAHAILLGQGLQCGFDRVLRLK